MWSFPWSIQVGFTLWFSGIIQCLSGFTFLVFVAVTPPDSLWFLAFAMLGKSESYRNVCPGRDRLRFSVPWLNGLLQWSCCTKKLLPFPHLFKRKEWSLFSFGSNSDINYTKIVQASDTGKNYVAQMANATLEQESPYWHSLVSPQSLCWHLRTLFLGINLSLRCCKERPELSKRAWRFCPRSQSLEDRYCNAEQSYPCLPV